MLLDIAGNPTDNQGGIASYLGLILLTDIATHATPPKSNGSTLAARTQWTGDVIPKAGKGFAKFEIVPYKGGVNAELVGETFGKSFKPMLTFSIAGTDQDKAEFENVYRHGKFAALYLDREERAYLHGTAAAPVIIETVSANFGDSPEAFKGSLFTLMCYANYGHAPYAGAITWLTGTGSSSSSL